MWESPPQIEETVAWKKRKRKQKNDKRASDCGHLYCQQGVEEHTVDIKSLSTESEAAGAAWSEPFSPYVEGRGLGGAGLSAQSQHM